MKNYILDFDEVILLESFAKSEDYGNNLKLILTSKKLIF